MPQVWWIYWIFVCRVLKEFGPSQGLFDNQQLFNMAQIALQIYERNRVNAGDDVVEATLALLEQSIADRQQILGTLINSAEDNLNAISLYDDVSISQRVFNVKMLWKTLDLWVNEAAASSSSSVNSPQDRQCSRLNSFLDIPRCFGAPHKHFDTKFMLIIVLPILEVMAVAETTRRSRCVSLRIFIFRTFGARTHVDNDEAQHEFDGVVYDRDGQ